MKSKAPLALIEMLIMLTVFSLAAAWCLQAFAAADRLSRESEARDRAVIEAQNAAELLRYCEGDYAAAAEIYGGSWDGESWRIEYDKEWQTAAKESVYLLQAVPAETDSPLMGKADVSVTDADGDVLFEIPAAWQEK